MADSTSKCFDQTVYHHIIYGCTQQHVFWYTSNQLEIFASYQAWRDLTQFYWMQIKIWEYVVHDLNFSMRRMSQNANSSVAISGVFNKTIVRPNTTQTLMNISGMDYPHQVANNHLAKPTYIQTVDALLYCQDKRTMCTALIKLTVITYLFCCPPTGTISQRTCF